jgi:hypothetical protein
MPHGFDAYRVFVSAPGDLEREHQACYDAIAQANETTAMPAQVLLVPVGLRNTRQIETSRNIVSENVRWSTYFIQVFEDDWGPRDLFRKLFLLAADCRRDASMPMREVVVFLKDAPNETNPHILAFRKELEERHDVIVSRYKGVDELKVRLTAICVGWARAIIDSAAVPGL